nr:UbiA prenyltransferase [Boreostereum vibrans]
MADAHTPLIQAQARTAKLPFPLGLCSERVRPYVELIRFQKPTGSILMFWPFAWGLTLAAFRTDMPQGKYWTELAISVVAAVIVRGSACTINDIFDREYDAGVERTKGRPLASGRISVLAASLYLLVQYLLGIALFALYNKPAFIAGLIQLLPLFIVYPLMKRITHLPQAWLGICMNFGLIVSWAAVTGGFDVRLLVVLMVGAWGWTMHYDTIYACQDRRDDVKVGVKSTAILLGDYAGPVCFALSMMFVGMLAYAGVLNSQSPYYFIISVGGTAAHIIYQYALVDLQVPTSCGRFFDMNGRMGIITWLGMLVDYLVKIDAIPLPKL